MRGRRPETITPGTMTRTPPAPNWLGKEAKAEWKRVAPVLVHERKTLTPADLPTLAAYCMAVDQLKMATEAVSKEGLTVECPSGIKAHPAVAMRTAAMTQIRQLAGELGLTPVSRSRPAQRDAEDDGELEFLG